MERTQNGNFYHEKLEFDNEVEAGILPKRLEGNQSLSTTPIKKSGKTLHAVSGYAGENLPSRRLFSQNPSP